MIRKLISYIRIRRALAKAELRQCGYDYAMQALKNGAPVQQIETEACDVFGRNEFNYGMQSAILNWDAGNYEANYSPRAPIPKPPKAPATAPPFHGCGDCDIVFSCYDGKTKCIRGADYSAHTKDERHPGDFSYSAFPHIPRR
jgi:hypothetical protein